MNSNVQQQVNKAMALMQSGQFQSALVIFESLQQAGMVDFRLSRSIGVAHERLGNLPQACHHFERALELKPGQLDLMQSLSRLYSRLQQWQPAEQWLNKEIQIKPSLDAWCRLASLYLKDGNVNPAGAEKALNAGISGFGKSESTELLQAQLDGIAGLWEQQLKRLHLLYRSNPKSKRIKRALAWSLKQSGMFEQAITYYEALRRESDYTPDDAERLGLALLEGGQLSKAIESLQQDIQRFPLARNLNKLLSTMRYENNEPDFLSNYLDAVNTIPLPLVLDCIDRYIESEQLVQANDLLTIAHKRFGQHPALLHVEAVLAYKNEQDEKCIELCSRLINAHGASAQIIERRVLASLAIGELQQSQSDISLLLQHNQDDQFYLALQSTLWRLQKDERYHELCDYEALVNLMPLATPQGTDDTAQFLNALHEDLTKLHITKKAPLQQSVRLGSQTPGNLFARREETITELKNRLLLTCENAVSNFKTGHNHPTLRRATQNLNFTASWSVYLKESGYHTSHVHPKGWLSSAFYINVPKSINDDENSGYLYFGKPGIRVCEELPADYWIKPEAGHLALFPSFLWHGTMPFNGPEPRVSVAFDLLPQSGGPSGRG